MEHKARYQALVEFLLPYQEIWRNEIMLQYPRPVAAYPAAWLKELRSYIAPAKALRLAQGKDWDTLKAPGIAEFHAELTRLTRFDATPSTEPMPIKPQSWVHIIPKKQHEIERLAPLIKAQMKDRTTIVDIGGGQGHLAQSLAHHYGLKVLSLDMDKSLQKTGEHRQKTKWPDSPYKVRFHPHRLVRQDELFVKMLDHETLTSGLHTCGPLALAHMEAAVEADAVLVNMPCCYHKLRPEEATCSGLARYYTLPWNQFALTLASGAHRKVELSDVEFRTQVKRYRYALHFLLHDEFNRPGHVPLGNCPRALYYESFAAYAREQFGRLGIDCRWDDEALNQYVVRPTVVKLIDGMLAATILRDTFGRALEAALLSDRAVWLEEQGREVELLEVFDPAISPRNLAIIAH